MVINHEEYEVLKELDDKWKWIAREDEEPYSIAELIEEYEDSKEYKDSLVIEYFMDKAKESDRFKMNDVDSIIGRLDEIEDDIGRIDKMIERLDDLEDRIDDLKTEVETTDTSPDVAMIEDEIKGIKTEIYYMRDELK